MGERISVVFDLLAQLAIKEGAAPLTKHPNGWHHKIDDHWTVVIAGKNEVALSDGAGTKIPPFHAWLEFNGWPAGLFNPYGGCIAAGSTANEDALIAILRAKIGDDSQEVPK